VQDIRVDLVEEDALEGKPFMLSADGELMPAKKGQAPPSLRYFDQPK